MNGSLSPESSSPKRLLSLVVLIAALLAVPAIVAVRHFTTPREKAPETKPAAEGVVVLGDQAARDAGVETGEVRRLTRTEKLEAPGVIALDEAKTARIGCSVEGRVLRVLSEVGDRVHSGKRLAELNSRVIHDVWADYRKAVAERRRRETEAAFAKQGAERATRLYEAKAISLQEKRRADVEQVAAIEELDLANTEVRRAEEALEHLGITNKEDPAGESGEEIPVTSPIEGVVLEKNVTTGTAVTAGMPLFVVSDLSSLWAIAEVDETRAPLIKEGLPVAIRVSGYPDRSFPGTITFVGDVINPKTRRVAVRCRVANKDGLLKPEMYASISLSEGAPHPILAVPASAIQDVDGKNAVFVVSTPGTFVKREVSPGTEAEGWTEVLSGVKEGEKIATKGTFLLKSELLKASQPAGD